MNTINKYFLLSAAALAGMTSFTACSSDDSSDAANANNGTELGVVKTQFAINVPYAKGEGTRMTETNTQGDGKNFLGISNIRLMSFINPNNNEFDGKTSIDKVENLGTDNDAYSKDNASTGGNFRSLYRDVTIPVGTTDIIFYGRATNNDNSVEAGFNHGVLNVSNAYMNGGTLGDLNFSLVPVAANANFATNQDAKNIIEGLNSILQSSITVGDVTTKWSEVGDDTPEHKVLKQRYQSFIKLTSGSGNAVRSTINGLKTQLGTVDATTMPLTAKILENCDAALTKINGTTFPTNLHLPEGAARLQYNNNASNPEFSYVKATANTVGDNAINYNQITYPASLAYYIKTKAMVSDEELTSLNGLPTYKEWTEDADNAWSGKKFTQSAVTAKTRSVALKDAIQYGVANLKLSVKCGKALLPDNQKVINGLDDQNIGVSENSFELKGVLVGGQPQSAGWNFESNTTNFDYVIYDNKINTTNEHFYVNQTSGSQYNYTLVLDNNKEEQDKHIYVTLELLNNAEDFYGENGLITKGSVFYLVGELQWDKAKEQGTGVNHIFTKDHTTIANFTINSLQKAYNCIPDLRSSKISVGLAVDLQWQKGVTFDYTIE